jgi:hypothetical protein
MTAIYQSRIVAMLRLGLLYLLAVVIMAFSYSVVRPASTAAAGEPVNVKMPFAGEWAWNAQNVPQPWTDANTSYPGVHHLPGGGHWSTDLYPAAAGEPVILRLESPNNRPIQLVSQSSSTTCGSSVKFDVRVDNVSVGWIYIAHLATVSGTIANGQSLGTVGTCDGVAHIHIEMKNTAGDYACWVDHGAPGAALSNSSHIGVLGANGTATKQACTSATGGGTTAASWKMTSSTEDAPMAGDINGDGWGDVVMVHKNPNDNGANIHVLFGSAGTPFQHNPTFVRSLPAPTWDYNRMKFAVGRFNTDAYADLAVIYKQDDNGGYIHVFYGAPGPGLPFQVTTPQRGLPASDTWFWDYMKIVSGDFNGDSLDDIVIGHKLGNGGMGIHLLLGGAGVGALNNPNTGRRNLEGPEWLWDSIKLAAGPFNSDNNADLVVVYNNSDVNIHIFNGGAASFTNSVTSIRGLPGSQGWSWSQMKLAAGQFNDDLYADLAILHRLSTTDAGIGVHALYGNPVPFGNATTSVRSLPTTANWNWDGIKLAAGPVQGDNWSDVAILQRRNSADTDVNVLYGNPSSMMFNYNPTSVRWLSNSAGWNWYDIKL